MNIKIILINIHLAQAMSWMTEPNKRNVQLKANPTAFQCGPSKPSNTSNHCIHIKNKQTKVMLLHYCTYRIIIIKIVIIFGFLDFIIAARENICYKKMFLEGEPE